MLWIRTNILVSRPISQRREDWSGLPEFPHLLGAAVAQQKDKRLQSIAAATERQGTGQAGPICLPEGYYNCCFIVLSTEPTLLSSSDEQKPPCCTHTWTGTHKSENAMPSSTATPPARYCHSFLTKQNSAHGMVSVGVIIFIIWIILLTTVLIV